MLISFVIGAGLDLIRHQPFSLGWSWQVETASILLAAWLSVALLARWPRAEHSVVRATGLLLLALFVGSLALHFVLAHP